jgi:hypothetical protein
MTSQPITQPHIYDLFITYSLVDQALMQRLLLKPMARTGLRVVIDHRQQSQVVDRADHPIRQSRAVLLAMSAASYKNMLAYAEMLRFGFEQIADAPPLWVVLLDGGVPRDLIGSFTLWDFSDSARQDRQVARLIRRLGGSRTVALLALSNLELDVSGAQQLGAWLRRLGHKVLSIPSEDADWTAITRDAITSSDYLVTLMSEMSVHSDLLAALVTSAHEHFLAHRRPRIIPVLQESISPPTRLAEHLERWPLINWDGNADHRIYRLIAQAITLGGTPAIGESEADAVSALTYRPALQPTRNPEDQPALYIERDADHSLRRILRSNPGTTTTIQGIYGTGKTTLLRRALADVRDQGRETLLLDVPLIDPLWLGSIERLSHYVAMRLADAIGLDHHVIDANWSDAFSPSLNLTRLLEQAILPQQDAKLVLGIDDADWLLDQEYHDSFFGMLRSWHNNRARDPVWNKLDIVLAIATDPHLLIGDINQSPFNVGEKLYLDDFNAEKVAELGQFYHPALPDAELDQLYGLLGGQPGLTTQALISLARHRSASIADMWVLRDHIRACRWAIGNRSATWQALREVIERGRCISEREFYRLAQLGLAKGDDPRDCAPRCQWYAEQLVGIL